MKGASRSPATLIAASALWMAVIGNLPLWRSLAGFGIFHTPRGVATATGLAVAIFGVHTMVLALVAWRWSFKGAAATLLFVTAASGYFMLTYGVVMDPGMVTSAFQTDLHEAAGLFSWRLVIALAVAGALPAWMVWRQRVDWGSARRQALRNALLAVAGLAITAAAILASFQGLAAVMRNHKEVRYLVNPMAAIYSAARGAARPLGRDESVLVRVGEDATRASHPAGQDDRPPLLLLVLGETARSDNFSINGYPRPTTPGLEREGVVSFRNAWSCGTSTAASVPCMFSDLGRERFEARTHAYEGLLDVLHHAGLAVLWIDNQSGCKGVCDRVPSVSTGAQAADSPCPRGECLDGVMLEGLDARIAALDPARVARGLVVVMHQMGSHGPAYHLRSPAALKRFQPECASAALDACTRESLVNAYDNSIAYTDHFLVDAIGWLKSKAGRADTALMYVSDHGESLGEHNLYLHGLPYAVAPDVQKHVPWITWLSEGFSRSAGVSAACLQARRDQRLSHDNYFHAVLGLMAVRTSAYRPDLDPYAPCTAGAR